MACHLWSSLDCELEDKFVLKLTSCLLSFPPSRWARGRRRVVDQEAGEAGIFGGAWHVCDYSTASYGE
jgi:hypothetical protein